MLALLLAASVALAAPVTDHTVQVDLFQEDPSPDKPDWEAARRGPWTKPYIPWTIDAGQGDGIVDFGDVRFRDEVVTGHDEIDVVMVVRVNGIDDYSWVTWNPQTDLEVNLQLASRPKDPNYISSDPSTRIWEDQPGFYLFDHNITNLTVTGLPWSNQTTIEVIFLAVVGVHDSMASHRLTHCVGSVIVPGKEVVCGGTDLKLMPFGGLLFRPFPNAPEVAPAMPTEEPVNFDDALRDIFKP